MTSSTSDHGNLAGLTDDDHTQYLLLDGTRPLENTGTRIWDTGGDHYLTIKPNENLAASRILNLVVGAADRTITLQGNPTLDDWFDQDVQIAASPTFANVYVPHGGFVGVSSDVGWTFDSVNGDISTLANLGIGTASPGGYLDAGGWTGRPGTISTHSNILGDLFVGNDGSNVSRARFGSNANQGFFQFNRYYTGAASAQMDVTKPSWTLIFDGVADNFAIARSPAGGTTLADLFVITSGGAIEMYEMTAPAAGAVNTGRLFLRDNGAGKTQLCVIFNTGAIQVIATQP